MSRFARRAAALPLFCLAALLAAPAAAQVADVPTSIQPDIAPGRGLGTTVTVNGSTYTVDGGTRAGANLFHSFADFSLGSADRAAWVHSGGNPASIANVVNRVTGGNPSAIFGEIDSTAIPNADFYFINPAGIVFGLNATVNVPAAAHFSTGSDLFFSNGDRFSIATPDGSTLSIAAPEAFGFVGTEQAIVVDNRSGGITSFNGNASLSASDVGFLGAAVAAGGLTVAAVGAAPAFVAPNGAADRPLAGSVVAAGSFIGTSPDQAPGATGDIFINAGSFLSDSSIVTFAGAASTGGNIVLLAQ